VANSNAAELSFQKATQGRCMNNRSITVKKQWLPDWENVPPGVTLQQDVVDGVAIGPGGSLGNFTGSWRTVTPRYLKDKCIRCLRCWFSCPEGCIKRLEDDHVKWDYRYCKGCAICSNVCPVQAIQMEKGVKEW
jgi:2-oxoacid:acceptor oxidoreductase delta subunit (pyruvate/2-ketoisovalerate family)